MSDASKRQVWERKKPENAWKQVNWPQQQVWMPTRAYAIENIPMTRTLVTDAIAVRIIGSHLKKYISTGNRLYFILISKKNFGVFTQSLEFCLYSLGLQWKRVQIICTLFFYLYSLFSIVLIVCTHEAGSERGRRLAKGRIPHSHQVGLLNWTWAGKG